MVVLPINLMHLLVMILFDFVNRFVFLFLVLVATVVILMATPRLETYPTEFVPTPTAIFGACHVVAPLVLFNVFVADRTLFGVDDYPIHILGL